MASDYSYIYNMEISYTTKEQQKAEQQKAFLKLTPVERFQRFLDLMEDINWFGVKEKTSNSYNLNKNFIIEKRSDKEFDYP